jgi:uncharacterized protein
MSPPETLRVEFSSAEVLPHGESLVLSLVDGNSEVRRMELPSWALHQLMRILPRLDAALLQARQEVTSDLIAYPVTQWDLQRATTDRSVALIDKLRAKHGPLMLHQSGSCCGGSAPMCTPQAEFIVGDYDKLLGHIGGVPGRGGMFSLEWPEGLRFLTRSRLYADDLGGAGNRRRESESRLIAVGQQMQTRKQTTTWLRPLAPASPGSRPETCASGCRSSAGR